MIKVGAQFRCGLLLGAVSVISPAGIVPAFAQEVAGASAGDESAYNEILVTAQRRTERLEDVPMSVAVITSDTLSTAGVTSLRDISNVTSGVSIAAGGAFPQPAIRGVTTLLNGTYENNVAVYFDGLYQPVANAINIDLPNVDNIQVLKGPQGTLYGRNATGGAILLTTVKPGDSWQGKGELTYARFDDKRATAYVAGPLSDKIGVSAAGYIRRSDGYNRLASRTTPGETTGGATPLKQDSLRLKLVADLSDTFSATLAYSYVRVSDARTSVYSPIENVAAGTYSRPGGATRPTKLGVQAYDLREIFDTKQHEGGLTLEWETGIGTLKSISGYSHVRTKNFYDFDGSYVPSSYGTSPIREKTFQQAIDYAIDAIEKVNLIVGATYLHDKLDFPGLQQNFTGLNPNNPGTTPGTLADYALISESTFNQTKNAWAAYIDATFRATDQLSINVGGRYSEEKQDVFSLSVSPPAYAAFGLARPANAQHVKFKKFTPRASIRYEISNRTNVYASYSQGFRTGAFNAIQPALVLTAGPSAYAPAKPEKINAFELGFKTASRGLRFEVAGFYYDYKDLQVAATKSVNGGIPFVDVTNAPKAKIYGAEASLELQPIENLTIRGSGTWLHARYGDGFLFNGSGVNPAVSTINVNSDPLKTYANVTQLQDLSGLQMSRSPNFSANLGADYLIPMGGGGVRLAANVKYTDSYVLTNPSVWGNAAGVPIDRQRQQRYREGRYALFNASVTWTDPSDHYYVRVFGTNLSDHRYRLHYTGTSSGTYSPMAEPRTFGGTVGCKF